MSPPSPPAAASAPPAPPAPPPGRWQALRAGLLGAFRAYADWLAGIGWGRFLLLSLLLLIGAGILSKLPPFDWEIHERVVLLPPKPAVPPRPASGTSSYQIDIGEHGVKIAPRPAPADGAAAASAAASSAAAGPSVEIRLPAGPTSDEVREAVEEARRSIEAAIADAEAEGRDGGGPRTRVLSFTLGEYLPQAALLFILASAVIKISAKGRLQAERVAEQATEAARTEALERQVVEARMAAMQAQVEPHFLFNTLASIDHLIEVDPARASRMQKNLIALLRAAMPSLREANAQGAEAATLARELAVVRPYLEILQMRMEERLAVAIDVPPGLLSAEFPPMMLQSLVENAIKHGLEPKAEGGSLRISAEVADGRLVVTVADSGLGFGRAATAGTGVGLANIRERLRLRYGSEARLEIGDEKPSGTRARIVVPYASRAA